MPAENVGIEHVPGRTFPDPRADARLRVEQPLGRQRLDAFAEHSSRYVEHDGQLCIARQAGTFRITPDDDVNADGARYFVLIGMAAAGRNHDEIGAHGIPPAVRVAGRSASEIFSESWLVSLPNYCAPPSCLFGQDQSRRTIPCHNSRSLYRRLYY